MGRRTSNNSLPGGKAIGNLYSQLMSGQNVDTLGDPLHPYNWGIGSQAMGDLQSRMVNPTLQGGQAGVSRQDFRSLLDWMQQNPDPGLGQGGQSVTDYNSYWAGAPSMGNGFAPGATYDPGAMNAYIRGGGPMPTPTVPGTASAPQPGFIGDIPPIGQPPGSDWANQSPTGQGPHVPNPQPPGQDQNQYGYQGPQNRGSSGWLQNHPNGPLAQRRMQTPPIPPMPGNQIPPIGPAPWTPGLPGRSRRLFQ